MLRLVIGSKEGYNNETKEFVQVGGAVIELEHSLASVSKWESIFEKPFLSTEKKTSQETYDYIKVMTTTPDIPSELFESLSQSNLDDVNKYIDKKMTATWFKENPNAARSREVITSEIIYYWMVALNVPFETQHWHLNRLLTLIQVINEKNQPEKKKMSRRDLAARNRQLNAERQSKLNTTG